MNLEQARNVHNEMLRRGGNGDTDASATLRAVIAAHAPMQPIAGGIKLFVRCSSTCRSDHPYPCHTVMVAAQALGVALPGSPV